MSNKIIETLGNIDIYLFDQLLKGRFDNCKNILDAGCGTGRNIVYFLKNGFQVYGVDQNSAALEEAKRLSAQLAPSNSLENFKLASVESLPFNQNMFDIVVCNAVLHFAKNRGHFEDMLSSLWNVLKPGGYLFTRLASNIGIETLVKDLGHGLFLLPDGSTRYLVDLKILLNYTDNLGGELYEPIKTTNVQNLRCMTTWCIQKKLM